MKEIPLTQGKVAIVDYWWYDYLMQWKWFARKHRSTFYAFRNRPMVNGQYEIVETLIHRLVASVSGLDISDKKVDHINRNGLDNVESNLRVCSNSQNIHNSGLRSNNNSGFKGVSWDKRRDKWRARITVGYRERHLGQFGDVVEAARAYDQAAIELVGEFAGLNFPEEH